MDRIIARKLFRILIALVVIAGEAAGSNAATFELAKRISIVKDISTTKPHRAHIDILADIALTRIKVRGRGLPTSRGI